jgi:hypothetical protein
MKVGDKIKFYLFGIPTMGEVYEIDKQNKTVSVLSEDGYRYPKIQTFKTLPKKKKEVPPWYILK